MEKRKKTQNQDLICHQNSDKVESRYCYYSDDFDSASQSSDLRTDKYRSRSADFKRTGFKDQKPIKSLPQQAHGTLTAQFPANKRKTILSLAPKPSNVSTKTMSLSTKLLNTSALRNKLHDLQAKLEELQKENQLLQKLQIRQEKALNKFEDTKHKISDLISRHNNEVRKLKEYLQGCKEQGPATVRRVKTSHFYRGYSSSPKVHARSVVKHQAERKVLEQKLVLGEKTLNVRERKTKVIVFFVFFSILNKKTVTFWH
ncbi:lebercilin-like [Pleurodeles waltl]|uniref:lebercilin-like n=1 Tax=Pleurodeles waltl TaxID=8319 RepID=UPI0037096AE2